VTEKLQDIPIERVRARLEDEDVPKAIKRLTAAREYLKGNSPAEIEEEYGWKEQTVYNWLNRFENRSFEDALYDDTSPGRPSKLTEEQLQKLTEALNRPPQELGYDKDRWGTELTQRYLREEFNAEFSARHTRRLMHRAGVSPREKSDITGEERENLYEDLETDHHIFLEDSRDMGELDDESVDLVVTSPPYPLIKIWDDSFSGLNPKIKEHIENEEAGTAFEKIHSELDKVWEEVDRVLSSKGIVCVNIGDAARTLGDDFQIYPNHMRVTEKFREMGYQLLPSILWRKQTNRPNRFVGSGMIPPNSYVALEHEHILVLRKGGTRSFEPKSKNQYRSAYFWEERNRWFSDLWTDIKGEMQKMDNGARERSAAYPLEIPYRLINMYSTQGDLVLDPFLGTGTTTIAAMCSSRNSVAYELEDELMGVIRERAGEVRSTSEDINHQRLTEHKKFVERKRTEGEEFGYQASNYDFPVKTKQERDIQFYFVDDIERRKRGEKHEMYLCQHSEYFGEG
jgi:DNA modification methylase/transposase